MVETDSPWMAGWHRDVPLAISLCDIPSCWTCSRYLPSSIWQLSTWLQPWQVGAVALRHFWILHLQQALMWSSWMNQQENWEHFNKACSTFQGNLSEQIKEKRRMSWHCLSFSQHSTSWLKAALAMMNRTGTNCSVKLIVLRWYPAENDRINNSWKPLIIIWYLSWYCWERGCLGSELRMPLHSCPWGTWCQLSSSHGISKAQLSYENLLSCRDVYFPFQASYQEALWSKRGFEK